MVELERSQMAIWRRVACWIGKTTRAHADTHAHTEICNTFLFHGNKGFVNAPQCYVTHTLLVVCLLCVVLAVSCATS